MTMKAEKLIWHVFGGGTGAAPGKNSYQSSQTDFGQYMIDPISWENGRHRYYRTNFVNNKGARSGGLYQQIATGDLRTGKRIAKEHFERIQRGLEPVSELHSRMNSPMKNPRKKNPSVIHQATWEYETATGVPVRGTLEKTMEGQGTDVTYFFRRETGELDVISGSQLKKIKRIANPRKKTTRKKNPEIETRELSLYADNLGPSSQKEYEKRVYEIRQDFLRNVRLNNKRVWTKKRLMNLTKHAAHMAARAYSEDFGSGAFRYKEIFSDADINNTAKYLYESWFSEGSYAGNPKRRATKKKTARKKNPKSKNYLIFNWNEYSLAFLHATNQWVSRLKAVRLPKTLAMQIAKSAAKRSTDLIGIVSDDVTDKQLMQRITSQCRVALKKPACRAPASGKARRSNPVGPTQKQIDKAANLFREFTGDFPGGSRTVKLPVPKTGLVIGELDGVLYTTVRDGKTEKYQHDFKKSSRPHLISSHDGTSLHILGGEYEFTERGIEDR